MKKTKLILSLLSLLFIFQHTTAQCIKDVYNLIHFATPCLFVGIIDAEQIACYDPNSPHPWRYTWKIRGADDGKLIATYNGMVFTHAFQKFGGYEFCLEIDKDNNKFNGPEIQECVTYTTCEFCGDSDIGIEYLSCPAGKGCNIELKASFAAENIVGVKPDATFIITRIPTLPEMLAGMQEQDEIYIQAAPNFFPEKGMVEVSQTTQVPYQRGCYYVRLVLDLELNAGAHESWGNPSCERIVLQDDETFRCMGCINENGDCEASIKATAISNEEGTCDLFGCMDLRDGSGGEEEAPGYSGGFQLGPNPASEVLHLTFPAEEGDVNVYLFDVMGRVVQAIPTNMNARHLDINTSMLSKGIYFLNLEKGGRSLFSQKVMIAK